MEAIAKEVAASVRRLQGVLTPPLAVGVQKQAQSGQLSGWRRDSAPLQIPNVVKAGQAYLLSLSLSIHKQNSSLRQRGVGALRFSCTIPYISRDPSTTRRDFRPQLKIFNDA